MKRHIARGAFVAASLMATLAFAAPADAASQGINGFGGLATTIERSGVAQVGGRYYGRHGVHGGFGHRGFHGRRHFGHRGFGYRGFGHRRHGFYGNHGYYGHRKFYGHGFRHHGFKHRGFRHHGHKGHGKKFFFGFKH